MMDVLSRGIGQFDIKTEFTDQPIQWFGWRPLPKACLVDIDMTQLRSLEQSFLAKVLSLFIGFLIILVCAGNYFASHYIIEPINRIAYASSVFAKETGEGKNSSLFILQDLGIKTHDEIEHLYRTIVIMAHDITRHIAGIQEQSERISRFQNGLIITRAELVESRDLCTGNHIKNTSRYVDMILRQMQKDGLHGDVLSEDYIRVVVSCAPLHDVGKIKVSDVILNKPGRLTDEEYAVMKQHTMDGKQIIKNAIHSFSDEEEQYLDEALNLALYHHERWDGKGYPTGVNYSALKCRASYPNNR